MKRTASIGVVLVTIGLLTGLAAAEVVEVTSAAVTIEAPKGWEVSRDANMVQVTTKDGSLSIVVARSGTQDLEATYQTLMNQVNETLTDVVPKDKKPFLLGKLDGVGSTARGNLQGAPMTAMIAALQGPGTQVVALFVLGQNGIYEKHEKGMTATLNSLAPAASSPFEQSSEEYQLLVSNGAAPFVNKVAIAILKNDQKAFAAMLAPKFYDVGGKKLAKAKVVAAIKKKKSIAKYLQFNPAGDNDDSSPWNIEQRDPDTISLSRGSGYGAVFYLNLAKVKGKWLIAGTFVEDHGEP